MMPTLIANIDLNDHFGDQHIKELLVNNGDVIVLMQDRCQ